MEEGNGLVKCFRREIIQLLLEGTEGDGSIVEVHRGLSGFQADAVLDKLKKTPGVAVVVVIVVFTLGGGDQSQRTVLFGGLAVQMLGNCADVILQGVHILKSRSNHLHNIAVTGFGADQEGLVNMTAAERTAGNGLAVQPEIA